MKEKADPGSSTGRRKRVTERLLATPTQTFAGAFRSRASAGDGSGVEQGRHRGKRRLRDAVRDDGFEGVETVAVDRRADFARHDRQRLIDGQRGAIGAV